MTAAALPVETIEPTRVDLLAPASGRWSQLLRSTRVMIGGGILLGMILLCLLTLPWTLHGDPSLYTVGRDEFVLKGPRWSLNGLFGYDALGRSVLARCLFG